LEKVNHCDKSRLVVTWGWDWGKGTDCKGAEDNFLEVLGLDFGGGYPTVCQNSSICTLKNG